MYFYYIQQFNVNEFYKIVIMMQQNNKSTLTTIGIDKATNRLIDKLCKRFNMKKGEIVRLAFIYVDKASINPADPPESVKTELAKIIKRQDDIIRFIRNYEEEKLNPMIRATNAIASRFDLVVKSINDKLDEYILASNRNVQDVSKSTSRTIYEQQRNTENILDKVKFMNNANLSKILQLISLYVDLSSCGITEGKKKESIRQEIQKILQR